MNSIDLSKISSIDTSKAKHDLKNAITSLQLIGELIESGYQFNDDSSVEIKNKYKQSVDLINQYINKIV